jgi:hypothetical protein
MLQSRWMISSWPVRKAAHIQPGWVFGASRTNGTNILGAFEASQTVGPGSASVEAGNGGVDYGQRTL